MPTELRDNRNTVDSFFGAPKIVLRLDTTRILMFEAKFPLLLFLPNFGEVEVT